MQFNHEVVDRYRTVHSMFTYVNQSLVRAAMTEVFVASVGTAFLFASTTCSRNCFSSSSLVRRVLNSSKSLTALSAVPLTTRSFLMRFFPFWYASMSFHDWLAWRKGKKCVIYVHSDEKIWCPTCCKVAKAKFKSFFQNSWISSYRSLYVGWDLNRVKDHRRWGQ